MVSKWWVTFQQSLSCEAWELIIMTELWKFPLPIIYIFTYIYNNIWRNCSEVLLLSCTLFAFLGWAHQPIVSPSTKLTVLWKLGGKSSYCWSCFSSFRLTEGVAVGRTFAALRDYHIDGNKEMITFGIMNMCGCHFLLNNNSLVNYALLQTSLSLKEKRKNVFVIFD